MTNVTQILSPIEFGDRSAAEQLLSVVYSELRKLAAAKLIKEKPDNASGNGTSPRALRSPD
jgi:ribosomal protein S20